MNVRAGIRRLRRCPPGHLGWLARLALLAAVLPVLIRTLPLRRLLELLTPGDTKRRDDPDAKTIVRYVDRLLGLGVWVYRPNCLKRSLLLYHFLRRAGAPAIFCLGVRRRLEHAVDGNDAHLHGHAWISLDGRAVFEPSRRLADVYRTTFRFPIEGGRGQSGAGSGISGDNGLLEKARPADASSQAAACPTAPSIHVRKSQPAGGATRLALLAACAQSRADEGAIRSLIVGASAALDWQQLIHDARLHGVLPLTARSFVKHCPDLIPEDCLRTLRQHGREQAVRNALLFHDLMRVLAMLDAAGVAAIPFKGPTLAIRAHGQLGLRQFSDLDVLIRHVDLPRISEAMKEAGFRHVRTGHVWQYIKFEAPSGGYRLDLQWGLAPTWFRFPLDLDGTWARAVRTEVDGKAILQPAHEDMLLLLSGHASKHCWSKLGWISDLNEFFARHRAEIDRDRLLERAREAGGLRGLLVGFCLVRELLAAELPPDIDRHVARDRQVARLAAQACAKLSVGGDALSADNGAFGIREQWAFHLRSRERLVDRLPYARYLISERTRRRQLLRGAYHTARRVASGERA